MSRADLIDECWLVGGQKWYSFEMCAYTLKMLTTLDFFYVWGLIILNFKG